MTKLYDLRNNRNNMYIVDTLKMYIKNPQYLQRIKQR